MQESLTDTYLQSSLENLTTKDFVLLAVVDSGCSDIFSAICSMIVGLLKPIKKKKKLNIQNKCDFSLVTAIKNLF